jgi:hypothetical protein
MEEVVALLASLHEITIDLLNYSKSIKLVAHIELKFNIKKKDAS